MNKKMIGKVKVLALVALVMATAGCAVQTSRLRGSALEYLYPEGKEAATPGSSVSLEVPLRIGLAFAPARPQVYDPFTESQKQKLLDQIAASFRERDVIARIEVIPGAYLTADGGFEEIERLKKVLGFDLVTLVSYDQHQFSESGKSSWTYWTLIGAYVVKGEKNETRTVMDAVVFDIPSRVLLFRAAGESSIGGSATPADLQKELRRKSETGFDLATENLVANLDTALEEFTEQAKSGTVRGRGTPEVKLTTAPGYTPAAGVGAGAVGGLELMALAALGAAGFAARRRFSASPRGR